MGMQQIEATPIGAYEFRSSVVRLPKRSGEDLEAIALGGSFVHLSDNTIIGDIKLGRLGFATIAGTFIPGFQIGLEIYPNDYPDRFEATCYNHGKVGVEYIGNMIVPVNQSVKIHLHPETTSTRVRGAFERTRQYGIFDKVDAARSILQAHDDALVREKLGLQLL